MFKETVYKMKLRLLFLAIFSCLLAPCVLESGASSVKEDEKDEEKRIEVLCAIINGKINNPSKCNKLQKKILERRCKKQKDPNACKAIEVVKKGKDPDGENLVKIKAKSGLKSKPGSKLEKKSKAKKKEK